MRLSFRAALATTAVAATLAVASPAAAQMVSAANPESVAAVLRAKGFQAQMGRDNTGDPMITSSAEGATFRILFYGCTNNKACQTIQFYAGFQTNGSVSLAKVNEWNRTKRFGRAYIDSEDDAVIEMDVDLDDGGMSRLLFEDHVEFWTTVLGNYRVYIRN